jgi:hypothetical protein
MLGRYARDMTEEEHTEGERAVSNGVELVGVSVVSGTRFPLQIWESARKMSLGVVCHWRSSCELT